MAGKKGGFAASARGFQPAVFGCPDNTCSSGRSDKCDLTWSTAAAIELAHTFTTTACAETMSSKTIKDYRMGPIV